MSNEVVFKTDLAGVNWEQLKQDLAADAFDNGRTPEQLRLSFENSGVVVLAWCGDRVIGKARALTDGVCNAYVVDVWTHSAYRRRGIAREMMRLLLSRLPGQHVYLFTEGAMELYRGLGFREQSTGMGMVVGEWLRAGGVPQVVE